MSITFKKYTKPIITTLVVSLTMFVLMFVIRIVTDASGKSFYDILGEYYKDHFFYHSIELSIIITCIYLILIMVKKFHLVHFDDYDEQVQKIKSNKLKSKLSEFVNQDYEPISEVITSLCKDGGTQNILWEFTKLKIPSLEINQSQIDKIMCEKITTVRRQRITSIADSLIHKKNSYLTTETRLPSEIWDTDNGFYWRIQKETLFTRQPIRSHRFLIISARSLINEVENETKYNKFKEFIEFNKYNYLKSPPDPTLKPESFFHKIIFKLKGKKSDQEEKTTELRIITFFESIDKVFGNYDKNGIDGFYDFAISVINDEKTIFAQNDKGYLRLLDSEITKKKDDNIDSFHNWYKEFLEYSDQDSLIHIDYHISEIIDIPEKLKSYKENIKKELLNREKKNIF